MEILGVGWQEFIFILIIALIVLGPRDMQKAGRTIGRWLNQLIQSDSWKVFQKTSSELRNLPRNLMREANMEMMEAQKEIRHAIDPRPNPSAGPSALRQAEDRASPKAGTGLPPANEAGNTTQGEPSTTKPTIPDYDPQEND